MSLCKMALQKKYFFGNRLGCLDNPPMVRKGSSTFSICLKDHGFFSPNITWILGNGKHIKIWEDSIMGDHPLNQCPETDQIKEYRCNQNIVTL